MTKQETEQLTRQLKQVFDVVRLVDVSSNTQYVFDEQGELIAQPYVCYAVWNKHGRCENCISAKAYAGRTRLTKFEFVDHDVYYVISMYLEVDDVPYMLEMVNKVNDDSLFGAYGKNEFVEAITGYNQKLYIDPLTGAYNRRYYEEQLSSLRGLQGVAMVDVDYFKQINDSWGHQVGDMALRGIVEAILSCVRSTDAVVRYGGDEFMILFRDIPREVFGTRLETVREKVGNMVLEGCPELKLSVSIGGAYRKDPEEELVRLADEQLYQAKKTRNTVCWA